MLLHPHKFCNTHMYHEFHVYLSASSDVMHCETHIFAIQKLVMSLKGSHEVIIELIHTIRMPSHYQVQA